MQAIAALCQKYSVDELSIFGSALRDDFSPDSDFDFLVRFLNDDMGPWAGKLTDLERELADLLGRGVDLISRNAVEQCENHVRQRHILSTARTVYVA